MARRLSLSHPVPLLWQPLSHSKGQGAGLAGGQGAGSVCLLCGPEVSVRSRCCQGEARGAGDETQCELAPTGWLGGQTRPPRAAALAPQGVCVCVGGCLNLNATLSCPGHA